MQQDWTLIIVMAFGMMIPLVAIIGGITAGIMKSNARSRLLELAQRERIVAIERGLDPEKLPKIQLPDSNGERNMTFEQRQLRRSQLLMIWGLIVTGFGLAMFIAISLAENPAEAAPTMMFVGIGAALILSSRIVKPDPEDLRRDREARAAEASKT